MIKYNFTDGYVDGCHGLMDGYGYIDGYQDGYSNGYNFISCNITSPEILHKFIQNTRQVYEHQLNIKLTEEDMKNIFEINKVFFENEASNSMLGRILIRKGITFYQKINNNLT